MKDYAKMSKPELLRHIAELEKTAPESEPDATHARLVHDLQVHQIELETQNHELREAQRLLEVSRDRYADLFDFAPVGYVTLDQNQIICAINLTAAGLLGAARTRLLGAPFHLHIVPEDLAEFRSHLRALTGLEQRTATEVRLLVKGCAPMPVLIQSMLAADTGNVERLYRSAITDLSPRRGAEEALRNNEARLSAILETAAEGILTIDEHGSIESVNRAAQEIFGYAEDEVVGRNFGLLLPALEREKAERGLADYVRQTQRRLVGTAREITGLRRNGSVFPMEFSVSEVRIGERRFITGMVRDISARRQAESALRVSEERLRLVLQASGIGSFHLELATGAGVWNSVEYELLGLAPGEVPAGPESFFRFVHAEDLERLQGEWGEALRTGHLDTEFRIVRADGEERWLAGKGRFAYESPAADGGDAAAVLPPTHFLGVNFDITLRKRAEQALESRRRQQQAVAELSQHAVEGRDLTRLMQDATALVPQVLGVEKCEVLELLPESRELRLRATMGGKKKAVGRTTEKAGRASQAGFTLLRNEPTVVGDYAHETRFPVAAPHRLRSGVSVVIPTRGLPFGVLAAQSSQPHRFGGDDVHFVQSIANVLGAALDRHRLEEELLRSGDEERARIGHDLHDDLCQQLTGIELRAEVLKNQLASASLAPAAQEELERIGGFLRTALVHARALAHGLSPVQFEANGLMSALQELVGRMTELFRVPCEFLCAAPVHVADLAMATHLYRIAQEAMSNAVRHSRAQTITVTLAVVPGGAVLTIRDDGIGCTTPIWKSPGMGLRTMKYRSEIIGARLHLEPVASGGTAVVCEFSTGGK